MALANAVAGAIRPSQVITWLDGDSAPINLTGATLTGKIRSNTTGVVRDIVGTLTVTDAAGGVFVWDYHPADVAESGHFVVQFTANYDSPPTPARTIAESWEVYGALGE